jgi:hypothetical protein
MRANPLQNSFTGGLLSARLAARNDIEQINSGLRQSVNGLILPHGGHMKRPGTYFVAEAKNRTSHTVLYPFDVSSGQQYVMEFGKDGTADGYIRFFANGGVVESSPGVPLEVNTVLDDPESLRVAQNADKMWIISANTWPYVLTRTAFAAFSIGDVPFRNTGNAPCRPPNTTSTTLTWGGANPGTLTASAATFSTTNDVGRHVRIESGGSVMWFKITSVSSTTLVNVNVVAGSGLAGATPYTIWSLGLFSDTEGCRAVSFHQGRLWYGGATQVPDWIVGSVSDDFDNFDRGTSTGGSPTNGNADRSIAKRIVSNQLNAIQWIKSFGQILGVGCSGGEFRIFGSNNDILTPTTTSVRAATNVGSAQTAAATVDNAAIFVARNKRSIYELRYDVLRDQMTARNLTLFAEDIFDANASGQFGAHHIAYQSAPDSVIWSPHGDGTVVALTYNPDQRVLAAGKHTFGSAIGGFVFDIAVIQSTTGQQDTPWFVGDFTVNGQTKRYIFYMADYYRPPGINRRATNSDKAAALNTAYFVDLGLETTFGSPTSTVSGLSHLEGCTVQVLIDGKVHPDVVVSGGQITTNFSGLHFVVGLQIPYYGETERFVGGATLGTDVALPSKIARVGFSLMNSIGGKFGTGNGITRELQPIEYPATFQEMGESPPLFIGELEVAVEHAWGDDKTIYWENNQPLPFTLLAVGPRLKVGER